MKRIPCVVMLVCGCVLGLLQRGAAAQPALDVKMELFAHGSGERLWYTVTTPGAVGNETQTFIQYRQLQEEWQRLADMPSGVLSMSDVPGQLIISLENGEWKRISPEQFASGLPLPGRKDILAVAGDGPKIYAIGFAEGALPAAATAPSTLPAPDVVPDAAPTTNSSGAGSITAASPVRRASASTVPSTVPSTRPEQLQLYTLGARGWARVAELPVDVVVSKAREISLVIFKGEPLLGYRAAPSEIRLLRYVAAQKAWLPAGQMDTAEPVRRFKLIAAGNHAVGWAVGEQGVGAFFFPKETPGSPPQWVARDLSLLPSSAGMMDADVALAGDELRLLVLFAPAESIFEQKYDLSGNEKKKLTELPAPTSPNDATTGDFFNWTLLGVMMVMILTAANRRAEVQVTKVNEIKFALAPLNLRLAAGLIDLWPIWLWQVLIGLHFRHIKFSQFYTDRFALWVALGALAAYLLHTLVAEMIWSRSLGKMFVGLSVQTLEGKRPGPWAVVVRNMTRMLDVLLFFVPLLVVLFNPLRQRIGDFAAATVVVAKMPVEAAVEEVVGKE